jgi:hypothetical protein
LDEALPADLTAHELHETQISPNTSSENTLRKDWKGLAIIMVVFVF